MGVDKRNAGIPFDAAWVESVRVNRPAVDARAAELPKRRSIKKEHQLAWLLRAIQCMDLTTLSGSDTATNVTRLCHKAKSPIRQDVLEALGLADKPGRVTTGAICVYPARVKDAVSALEGTGIPVASVATGFPHGQIPLPQRLAEIRSAVADGASEIDIVIQRTLVFEGNWLALYDEVKAMREACGDAHLKAILATGDIETYKNVAKASLVCMMAGADFIKTSTGKESVNATLSVTLIMARAIREYYEKTGFKVGYKPAGGIRTAKQALAFMAMMREELGPEWNQPHLFRIGASSLLGDIERQLYHGLTGQYANIAYQPMA